MKFFTRSLLLLITVVVTAAVFSPLAAMAKTPYEEHAEDLDWQAKSSYYYDMVRTCFANDPILKTPDEKDPRIRFSSKEFHGYYGRGMVDGLDKGVGNCKDNDSQILRQALRIWGISEIEFTCNFFKRNIDGMPCSDPDSHGKFEQFRYGVEHFDNYIKWRVYGNKAGMPAISEQQRDEVKYLYFKQTFLQSCVYGKSESTTDKGTGDFVYKIGKVDDKGNTISVWYIGDKKKSDRVWLYQFSKEKKNGVWQHEWSCGDIAAAIAPDGYLTKAYAQYLKDHPKAAAVTKTDDAKEAEDEKSSCSIDGIGWIVCPAISELARLADNSLKYIQSTFLEVNSNTFSSAPKKDENGQPILDDKGQKTYEAAYTAWMNIRTFANLAFVVAFTVIIYSQLTNSGVNNYGIKKLLPRVIVAAILVNVSFLLCQIAIDLSNILGYNLMHFFDSLALPDKGTAEVTKATFATIAIAVLAGTAVAAVLAWPLVAGAVLAAVVSLLFVWLILVARQALVLLLVVIAPVAFVAYLLPNTNQWFTKWRKTFIALLAVFPVVGLLFGAGQMASRILMQAADENDSAAKLVALTVGVLPFFAVWPILKGSLDSAGKIGAKINGIGDRYTGKSKAWAQGAAAKSRLGKAQAFRAAQAQQATEMGKYRGLNPIRHVASGKNRLMNRLTVGDYGRHVRGEAEAYGQELAATAATQLKNSNLTAEQMNTLATYGATDKWKDNKSGRKQFNKEMKKMNVNAKDAATQTAAIGIAMAQNSDEANIDLMATTKGRSDEHRQAISQGALANKVPGANGNVIDQIAATGVDMNDIQAGVATDIEKGKFSVNSMADQGVAKLKIISDVLQKGYTVNGKDGNPQQVAVSEQQADALRKQAQQVLSNRDVSRGVTTAQADELKNILRPPSRGGANEGQDFNVHGK